MLIAVEAVNFLFVKEIQYFYDSLGNIKYQRIFFIKFDILMQQIY